MVRRWRRRTARAGTRAGARAGAGAWAGAWAEAEAEAGAGLFTRPRVVACDQGRADNEAFSVQTFLQ